MIKGEIFIHKHKLFISGNLGKTAQFQIDTGREQFRVKATRRIRFNFWSFYFHVKLQYDGLRLGLLKLIKITIFRIFQDLVLFPRQTIAFLFFRYCLNLKFSERPAFTPEIRCTSSSSKDILWVSRQSQVRGFFGLTRDHDLEWNMFRGAPPGRGYLLEVKCMDKKMQLQESSRCFVLKEFHPRTLNQISKPEMGQLRVMRLEDVVVDRLNMVVQREVAYPVFGLDYIEINSRPSPKLLIENDSFLFYQFDYSKIRNVDSLTLIPYSTNWYHFLVEGLSSLLAAHENWAPSPILMLPNTPANIKQVLNNFSGFKPQTLSGHEVLRVKSLQLVQDWRFESRFDFSSRVDDLKNLSKVLKERYCMDIQREPNGLRNNFDIIYLRRPAGLFRQMIDDEKVMSAISKNGVQVIEPSETEIHVLANLLNSAKIVLAETGAAITNLLFCKENVKFFEIQPPGVNSEFWKVFCEVLNIHHQPILSRRAMGQFGARYHFPLDLVLNVVKEEHALLNKGPS